MDGTAPVKNDIPMFLAKLWNLVDDPNTDALIRWSANGTSFVIQDPANFAKLLLPQYFKHRNLASFIRVLNMYGFRKVIKLDSGSLRSLREEMEFQHPCFVRGNEQLLICIKRKPATATQVANNRALVDGANASVPALANKESEKEITKVLNDVRVMRGKQESMDVRLNEMKRENENMWAELQELRSKHAHQQIVVNKLIEFFITLLHNTGNTAATQLRAPPPQLAIQTALDGPPSVKRPRLDNGNTSSPEGYRGPIIKDVTDAWSAAYPQQAPEVVDWDRLLSQNEGNGTAGQQQVLDGLRQARNAGSAAASPAPSISPAPSSTASGHHAELTPTLSHSASTSSNTLPPDLVEYILSVLTRPTVPSPSRAAFSGPSLSPAPGGGQKVNLPLNAIATTSNFQPSPTVLTTGLAPGSQIISVVPMTDVSLVRHQQQPDFVAASTPSPISLGNPTNYPLANQPIMLNGENGMEQTGRSVAGTRMEQQVDTIQSNLDYIRDLLQNPNYNLDLSQLYQLFPEVVAHSQMPQQPPPAMPNQANREHSANGWPQNLDKAIVEYQQDRHNRDDNAILSQEDHDDFMSVFNSLPADEDDLIEGVTIQIPEYPVTSAADSSIIPLPSSSPLSGSRATPAAAPSTSQPKTKRKSPAKTSGTVF